jgi:hypothetical protein
MTRVAILRGLLAVAVVAGAVAWAAQEQARAAQEQSVVAQEVKAIKDVMGMAHKGKDSLLSKITAGKGTDEDHKKLLTMYEALATFKPPMGEEKSWKEKTDALIAAAKELVEKKAGAADKLKAASNCKACHSVHKKQ